MGRPKKDTIPITQTIPPEWLMRADVLADAEHGALSRADVLRRALGIGLAELENRAAKETVDAFAKRKVKRRT